MSNNTHPAHAWNASQSKQIDSSFPSITSSQDNVRLGQNIPEIGVPPSLGPQDSLNPDSQYDVFSTGSLVEALSAPPSAARHGPALPPQRKAAHKRQSSTKHPYAPNRNAVAARAAVLAKRADLATHRRVAMRRMVAIQQASMQQTLAPQQALGMRRNQALAAQQTLFMQQAPRIPSAQIPGVSARLPLVPVRQAGQEIGRLLRVVPVEQGPVMPRVGNVTPARRVDARSSGVQSRENIPDYAPRLGATLHL